MPIGCLGKAAALSLAIASCVTGGTSPALGRRDRYGDPLPPGAVARMGTLRLWHETWVTWVGFSPNGRTIASAGKGGTVRLWDAATGALRLTIGREPGARRRRAAFSPDGRLLAVDGLDKTAYIWSLGAGKRLLRIDAGIADPQPLSFSLDGRLLAIASFSSVEAWDVASGKRRFAARVEGRAWSFALTPDWTKLAVAHRGHPPTLSVWEVAGMTERHRIRLPALKAERYLNDAVCVAFSPDGRLVASVQANAAVRLWDVATGELRAAMQEGPWGVGTLAFAPDGRTLASVSRWIHLWDVPQGKERRRIECPRTRAVAFAPDGRTLASGGLDRRVRLWDVASGRNALALPGHGGGVLRVAFSPDGRRLATGGGDATARIWEADTGKHLHVLRGHTEAVSGIAFSPDGTLLASGGFRGSARLWDTATGAERNLMPLSDGGVCRVAFSPDGKLLVVLREKGRIRAWDPVAGKPVGDFHGPWDAVSVLAFTREGKLLAFGRQGKESAVWDVASGARVATFGEHADRIWATGFSPDARTMAWRDKGRVHVWDVAGGTRLFVLEGPPVAGRPAFSPDGLTLACGGPKGSVLVWDAGTRSLLLRFEGHREEVTAVAFSPDGRRLASGSPGSLGGIYLRDPTALVWTLAPQAWAPQAWRAGLDDARLGRLWAELGEVDLSRFYPALSTLFLAGDRAVPLLRARLLAAAPEQERIRGLIGALDRGPWLAREKAYGGLEALGHAAKPALEDALKGPVTPELSLLLEMLLAGLERPPAPLQGERLRRLRAIIILSRAGTPAALDALHVLVRTAPLSVDAEYARRTLAWRRRAGR